MKKIIAAIMGVMIAVSLCSCRVNIKKDDDTESMPSKTVASNSVEGDTSPDTDTSNGVIEGEFTQEYEYDSDNQITKVSIYSKETKELRAVSENTYDKDGKLDSIVLKNADNKIMITNRYKYKNDPSGEPYVCEEIYYDSSDKIALTQKYEYSEENNCPIVSGYYDGNNNEITQDQANRIIEELNAFMYD